MLTETTTWTSETAVGAVTKAGLGRTLSSWCLDREVFGENTGPKGEIELSKRPEVVCAADLHEPELLNDRRGAGDVRAVHLLYGHQPGRQLVLPLQADSKAGVRQRQGNVFPC